MLFHTNFLAITAPLLLVPGIGACGNLFAQGDPSWKERFLQEAPPAWEKYRERAKQLQGSIKSTTISFSLVPAGEIIDIGWREIKQRKECALFLVQHDLRDAKPPKENGYVMGINDKYGFELKRESQSAPWVVANLDVDLSDAMTFRYAHPGPRETVVNWSTLPITFFFIPSFSWSGINDPGFTLKRVASITRNDVQAVKVEFDYQAPAEKEIIPSLKGWALFDPQHFWVIHEYNFQLEWVSSGVKGSTVVSYEYQESPDGFPIPKRANNRYKSVSVKGADRETQYEFDLKETKVSESDFTLSAFGLPEPPGMQRRWQPWYLWCAIAGMVCLSLAVLFRWRSRRGAAHG